MAYVTLPANCVFNSNPKFGGEKSFEIRKKVIEEIAWYDKEYEDYAEATAITKETGFAYEYDGKSHMPVAMVEGIAGDAGRLVVTGARINAGTGYTAKAALKDSSNYELSATANVEYGFAISPKTVWIKWMGENNSESDFTWTYTGSFICPTAVLTNKAGEIIGFDGEVTEGEGITVTVTGGKIAKGKYVAEAHDTFTNFDFATTAQGNSLTKS